MRVGFVRNVGLAVLGLAVAVTAACNDDPLSFDNDATFDIVTNPSSMTVPAGEDVQLATRAVNQGGEATWAEVTHVVAPACVTVEDDPDALEINPPGLFIVRGGSAQGDCTITLSAGGVEKTVAVTNVAGAILIVDYPEVVDFGQSVQFGASIYTSDEPPVLMGPFENSDADWSSDAPGVASVDEAGVVTGVSEGEATITACWTGGVAGYEICSNDAVIQVIVAAPGSLTGVSPASGDAFGTITLEGTDLVTAHEIYIDNFDYSNRMFVQSVAEDGTSITMVWPAMPDDGVHEIWVGIAPDKLAGPIQFTQNTGITAEAHEPANDLAATTTAVLTDGQYIGGFGTGETLDYIEVNIPADGNYEPVVDWAAWPDVDFVFYDEAEVEICHSWYSQPENECGVLELEAGLYYARVRDYTGATGTITTFTYIVTVLEAP